MYIIRDVGNEWQCLVHMHRKLGALMQIGGHIELNETPWQAVAHELVEESGYTLSELDILQPPHPYIVRGAVTHPTPFMLNTHTAGKGPHYHSDLCFAFIAHDLPKQPPTDGESADIRWMTLAELESHKDERVLGDVIDIYGAVLDVQTSFVRRPAKNFSVEKPKDYFGF